MAGLYKGYVETKNKQCIEKFKGRTDFKTYDQVKNLPEFAGILATDTMFIDIDDAEQSEIMMNIVEGMQLNCKVICTSRGKHFIFKNSQIQGCKTHCSLAIGLTADIKVGFKDTYEVLKVDGEERFVEWDIEEGQEYQEVPKWFFPVKHKMEFLTMQAGDGRNQELFNYILTLQSNDFTVDETRETIRIINRWVLPEPLSDDELEVILRDDAFKKPIFFNGAQFLFDKFGNYLINTKHIKKLDNRLCIYDEKNGIYNTGQEMIEKAMLQLIPNLSDSRRKEVLKWLYIQCDAITPADARYIAFRNGVYDVVDEVMLPFSPDIVVTNKIPWDYNPVAYFELADQTLNKLSCDDAAIRALLEECIGYCFYRNNFLQKAFILIGDKANGKSTFIGLLNRILGDENVVSLDLKNLNDRFSKATLHSKLANIGDDISDEFIPDASLFKKIVAGNRIQAEFKGKDPFEFNPYVKLIFSVNNMPRIRDKTGAVLRRLVIIPFNAQFKETDVDFDPYVKEKLSVEQSVEYLIVLGVQGLKRLVCNKRFTLSERVQHEIDEYEEFNNPILGFVREMDEEYGEGYLFRETVTDIYAAYQVYCNRNGLQPESNKVFGKSLRTLFQVESMVKKCKGKAVRFYVKVTT